ncbi:MAG: cellulase family glycosylhydrolase [Ignavibacteria bacterium]|nr:cellulase family glycosylhydrolase [Ignavibacteria bacterium]MBI3766748.1 cellulase family glycosylhydrolase [Ignavibacteriales bacterium]
MPLNRRTFLKATGSIALAGVAGTLPALSSLRLPESRSPKPRVAVFFEPTFPPIDVQPVRKETLQHALDGFDVAFLGVSELGSHLNARDFNILVTPYGSAFPKEAYLVISRFLIDGGNWLNLGGIPLSVPVVKEHDGWRGEVRQTEYHKRLGITQAFPVSAETVTSYRVADGLNHTDELLNEFTADEIYELYVRFAVNEDFPSEDGSAGARDAVLRPLIFGLDHTGRRGASPFIQIDRLQGEYAGGRWMLANLRGSLSEKAIRVLVELAMQGSMELSARSSFACYHEGEMPSFTIQFRRPRGDAENLLADDCRVEVLDEHRRSIDTMKVKLLGEGSVVTGYADLTSRKKEPLSPGLYQIKVTLKLKSLSSDATYTIKQFTGFWVFDKKLLSGGKPLKVDKNYFYRDGRPYPVTGTTYMTSDVHRKFLFEPNPYLWNNDFSEMKQMGINMVRTGIWTGWKNYMLDVGAPNEVALRALDAFVLTARKYDIPLIFTFFTFLPETWGGVNAYLDPRSVNAQKEFITIIAQRYRTVNDIIWDVINEPSFCNPQHLWECRPNYDNYESQAWADWLQHHHPFASDNERISHLQELYRAAPGEVLNLPKVEEFDDVNIFNETRPIKVIDYRLFAQEMFANWTNNMAKAIRSNGNRLQLITVGQDEGGTGERPSPQFFGDVVDFTCIHNWWFNDDLVWDNVVTKTSDKPNLIEETGVMFYEKMDGSAWRTEHDARNLLERKLAISIGAGGAGFVEWIWNTNPYMKSDNEAAIGLHRVDGTVKPELNPIVAFSTFLAANRHLMVNRRDEEALMVIPHSQQFSTRNLTTEATKKCVRVLSYRLNTPVRGVSEYRMDTVHVLPKLVVVPSPRTLNQKAWEGLMDIVEQGTVMLITGVIDSDDHWLPIGRSEECGFTAVSLPIAQEEFLSIDGSEYRLSYRGDKMQRVEKAVIKGHNQANVMMIPHGEGTILWSPIPVELSDTIEPIVELYAYAMKQANVVPVVSLEPNNSTVLVLPTVFDEAVLCTLVSECDRDTELTLTHHESGATVEVTVPAERTSLIVLRRMDGKVLAKL